MLERVTPAVLQITPLMISHQLYDTRPKPRRCIQRLGSAGLQVAYPGRTSGHVHLPCMSNPHDSGQIPGSEHRIISSSIRAVATPGKSDPRAAVANDRASLTRSCALNSVDYRPTPDLSKYYISRHAIWQIQSWVCLYRIGYANEAANILNCYAP